MRKGREGKRREEERREVKDKGEREKGMEKMREEGKEGKGMGWVELEVEVAGWPGRSLWWSPDTRPPDPYTSQGPTLDATQPSKACHETDHQLGH